MFAACFAFDKCTQPPRPPPPRPSTTTRYKYHFAASSGNEGETRGSSIGREQSFNGQPNPYQAQVAHPPPQSHLPPYDPYALPPRRNTHGEYVNDITSAPAREQDLMSGGGALAVQAQKQDGAGRSASVASENISESEFNDL